MIDVRSRDLIGRRLDAIERDEGVRVVYACESGSRAWGFASTDSDYDVRFIYVRPIDWYLSIDVERRRDVIERPLEEDIDLGGWDLRKALVLFAKSNPPLLEWLVSSIVYVERFGVADRLRALLPDFYSPVACAHHYLHMAHNNYREFLSGDQVKQKKYFYVLRPVLAIEWIRRGLGPVPMEFATLVDKIMSDRVLLREINGLLQLKQSGKELGVAPRNEVVCRFLDGEIQRFGQELGPLRAAHGDVGALNSFFRSALESVWSGSVDSTLTRTR